MGHIDEWCLSRTISLIQIAMQVGMILMMLWRAMDLLLIIIIIMMRCDALHSLSFSQQFTSIERVVDEDISMAHK